MEKKYEIKVRDKGFSVLRTNDVIGFKTYTVVNENDSNYYTVSVANNATLKESNNDEVFYIIKEKGKRVIRENINTIFPTTIVNYFLSNLNENEEYVGEGNSEEVLDYLYDTFNRLSYRVRHVIYYDNIEDSLDYEFLLIIGGDLDTIYLSVKENGDIFVVDNDEVHLLGDTGSPEYFEKSLSTYLSGMEHFTAMVNEDMDDEVIIESFNQTHGIVIENRIAQIYNKNTSKSCGYIDRRNGVYKLTEEVKLYGVDRLKSIVENYEVKQLLK